ncbi:hypothetical protein AGOR_G00094950 [Albula goreensis]|uniref:DBF4-type domain-containing protein n=1 Tax=Albula goreensis TaxID=1534307 RepID=A0A8T3DGN4_9TELE|nr:hypothetical protein AGOR_G00094950 [Albula goreensis]
MMQRQAQFLDVLGVQQLKGKSFYLDEVKSRRTALLVEAIARFEGKVESFLNKDVSFVISGSQEAWYECQSGKAQRVAGGPQDVASSSPVSTYHRHSQDGNNSSSSSQRAATPKPAVCGSRGKALLEKAIRNSERCHGSSVLANARSWGVKIVHVDDFMSYIDRLTVETAQTKSRKKKTRESPVPRVVKAGALKLPYMKIEDCSRKYKPLHLQSMSFPMLDYTGRFSPFEPPAPPPPERHKDQDHKAKERRQDPCTSQEKLPAPLSLTPSHRWARKKTVGFCECCQMAFKEQDEHLKSDRHRGFVQDSSHYSVVDQLVTLMQPGFADPVKSPATMRLNFPPAPSLDSLMELDPQGHSETEKAIQILLTQCSPPRLSPHPAQASSGVREMDSPATKPLDTTTFSISQDHVELDPVPLIALTTPTTVASCVRFGHFHLETGSLCEAGEREVDSKQDRLSVETQSSEQSKKDRPRSRTLPGRLSTLLNPRKRSRASSLSPRANKRQRMSWQPISEPTLVCPSISGNLRAPGLTPTPSGYESPCAPVSSNIAGDPCHNTSNDSRTAQASQDSDMTLSQSHSSVFIESALLPDPSACSPSSSESDWDCGVLSRLIPAAPAKAEQCLLDLDLLQRPCIQLQDSSYESRLCSVLHPPTPPPSVYGEDTDPPLCSKTLEPCLEACAILGLGVQH